MGEEQAVQSVSIKKKKIIKKKLFCKVWRGMGYCGVGVNHFGFVGMSSFLTCGGKTMSLAVPFWSRALSFGFATV